MADVDWNDSTAARRSADRKSSDRMVDASDTRQTSEHQERQVINVICALLPSGNEERERESDGFSELQQAVGGGSEILLLVLV